MCGTVYIYIIFRVSFRYAFGNRTTWHVYICIRIYIYIYIHTYTVHYIQYMHLHLHIHLHIQIHTHVHVPCTCTYTYTDTYTYTYTFTYTYTCIDLDILISSSPTLHHFSGFLLATPQVCGVDLLYNASSNWLTLLDTSGFGSSKQSESEHDSWTGWPTGC